MPGELLNDVARHVETEWQNYDQQIPRTIPFFDDALDLFVRSWPDRHDAASDLDLPVLSSSTPTAALTGEALAAEYVPASAVLLYVDFTASEALVENVMRRGTAWTRTRLVVAYQHDDDDHDRGQKHQPSDTHHPPPSAAHVVIVVIRNPLDHRRHNHAGLSAWWL